MPWKRYPAIIFVFCLITPTFFMTPCNADIIEYDWVDSIESYAYEIDLNTTAEIVVCVFPSLHGHGITDDSGQEISDIVKLGVYIFNEMPLDVYDGTQTGIGKSGRDNGVLVVLALEEQQSRIEVGYGLEGDITDIECNLITQQYLVPAVQEGNYGEGLYNAVVALGKQIPASNSTEDLPLRGYYYYESDDAAAPAEPPFWEWNIYGIPLWVIIVFALFGVFVPVAGGRARSGGRSGGGGSSGRW